MNLADTDHLPPRFATKAPLPWFRSTKETT
jgi:hypothetical protein